MKFTILLISLFSVYLTFGQREPIKMEKGYKIDIQTSAICEMCQYALEKDLAFEKGVYTAILNLEDKVMSVTYNPKKTSPEIIRKRITKVGYHADTLERDSKAYGELPSCCKDGSHGTPIPQRPLSTEN